MKRLLAVLPLLAACTPVQQPMIDACQQALSDRLKAPSTLSVVSSDATMRQIDRDRYASILARKGYGREFVDGALANIDSGAWAPTEFSVDLVYDAQNSFGGTVRGEIRCIYDSPTDSWPSPPSFALDIVEIQ